MVRITSRSEKMLRHFQFYFKVEDRFFLSDLSAEDVFEILSPEDVRRLAGQLAVAKLAAPTPFLGST